MNWLQLLGDIPGAIASYLNKRQEIKADEQKRKDEFENALHERRIELIKQGLAADANWEMEFARQAETSWKDEYTLLVVSIPAILAFVRLSWLDGPAIVKAGFDALAGTPLWYQGVLISLFLATVGIRYWRRSQSDT